MKKSEKKHFIKAVDNWAWKDCIIPNCKNKVCVWASNDLCFVHHFYGKPVSLKRIEKDRKKGLIP
jgi:hypothetical protein